MELEYPIRINRYLALHGYATRRKADELIEKGLVTINKKQAKLGDMVEKNDTVVVEKRKSRTRFIYLAYNKPINIVTTGPQGDEIDIAMDIKRTDVFPLGRLDKKSHGLILLTNDGRVTGPLLNPETDHEKEYLVTVDKKISNHFLKWMAKGVNIEGYTTKPARIEKTHEDRFRITITEGKTHHIRRMCAALGYVVRDLKRVRILNILLGQLKPHEYREIKGPELLAFKKELRVPDQIPSTLV
ncbi:MAG TPA: pseudouridine synthase [Candidatus Paceibacterota bacterium]